MVSTSHDTSLRSHSHTHTHTEQTPPPGWWVWSHTQVSRSRTIPVWQLQLWVDSHRRSVGPDQVPPLLWLFPSSVWTMEGRALRFGRSWRRWRWNSQFGFFSIKVMLGEKKKKKIFACLSRWVSPRLRWYLLHGGFQTYCSACLCKCWLVTVCVCVRLWTHSGPWTALLSRSESRAESWSYWSCWRNWSLRCRCYWSFWEPVSPLAPTAAGAPLHCGHVTVQKVSDEGVGWDVKVLNFS